MPPCRSVLAMSFAVCLSACAVGPDYANPEIKVPTAFEFWRPTRSNQSGIDPGQAAKVTVWWKTLHDPELNSLVERAVLANPEIEVALDRVQQAREHEIVVLGAALPNVGAGEVLPAARGPIRSNPPEYRRRSMPPSIRPASRRLRGLRDSMPGGNSICSGNIGGHWRQRGTIPKPRSKREARR
jgi:hypothetical protein